MSSSRSTSIALSAALILSTLGLFIATLLILEAKQPASFGMVCGNVGNCQQVLSSRFAQIDKIPLAAIGAGFYTAIILIWSTMVVIAPGKLRANLVGIAALATLLAALVSAGLLALQFHSIHAFCPLCCASAIDCFLLFPIFFYLNRHSNFTSQPLAAVVAIILLATIAAAAALGSWIPQHALVARVGSEIITAGDMQRSLGRPLRDLQRQTYRMQHDWIQKKLADTVLHDEAARLGITVDELLHRAVDLPIEDELQRRLALRTDLISESDIAAFRQEMSPHLRDQQYANFVKILVTQHNAAEYLSFPPVTEDDLASLPGWHRGADSNAAKARLVVFSDFACPYCAEMAARIAHVMASNADVSLTFHYFPHDMHERSRDAAIAAESAARQGKFWQYHDALMQHGGNLEGIDFSALAQQQGLNLTDFQKDEQDPSIAQAIEKSRAQAVSMGFDNTPMIFLNGRQIGGLVSESDLQREIRAELAE